MTPGTSRFAHNARIEPGGSSSGSAPRRKMRPVIEHVVRADPECFYIVDDIRLSSGRKVRFNPPTGWRALFRKK